MTSWLGLGIGLICLAYAGAPAWAQPTAALCGRLSVPEGIELDCALESDSTGLAAVMLMTGTTQLTSPTSVEPPSGSAAVSRQG